MVKTQGRVRSLAFGATALLVIAACSGTTATPAPTTSVTAPPAATTAPTAAQTTSTATSQPTTSTQSNPPTNAVTAPPTTEPSASAATVGVKGGTIYMLKNAVDFDAYDPQLVYTGEDLAFFGATVMRSLEAYKYSPDPAVGVTLVPDMATDLGTANADATQWSFTLRDGLTWQDGSPVTCADEAYGVSREFAVETGGGPKYATVYLDIPFGEDGKTPDYPGPYIATAAQQAEFDQAVVCDGNTITFHLKQSVSDFNFTTTLGMSAVSKAHDPGPEKDVGDAVWSDGPYIVTSYTPSAGGSLKMARNTNWTAASDDYRGAFPDNWEVDFGLDVNVIDARLMQSTQNDAFAIDYGGIQPQNLTTIFSDSHTANPQYTGRAFSDFDPYSRYYWINTKTVTDLVVRQAMAAALDRNAIRTNGGGDFVGDYADGAIKPNIGQDYAATGFWDTMLGEAIPDAGDPTFAKGLMDAAGITPPTLTWNYAISPTGDKNAAIVKASLEKAGFKIKIAGIDPAHYYSTIFDPTLKGDFGTGGWGADWPNATTVIPPLFTYAGGWDLSEVDDSSGIADWNAQVTDAQTTVDRAAQATKWQTLNSEAMQQVWIIPTFFGLAQDMGGTNVGNLYRWSAYGSWPYAQLYVKGP